MNKTDKISMFFEESGKNLENITKFDVLEYLIGLLPEQIEELQEDLNLLCKNKNWTKEDFNNLKELKQGHVINILVSEHELIGSFLDELEKLNQEIQSLEDYEYVLSGLLNIKSILNKVIISAESHYKREELLLSEMALLSKEISVEKIYTDHYELGICCKEIERIINKIDDKNFTLVTGELSFPIQLFVAKLRQCIRQENLEIYIHALILIKDESTWERLKKTYDDIGYCSFTPVFSDGFMKVSGN